MLEYRTKPLHVACQLSVPTHCESVLEGNLPLRPPVKNCLTTKTCSIAMPTIMTLSIRLKFHILCSVLLTVLKLRFSLVRKYFCCLVIVLNCPPSLRTLSSNTLVCSGPAPCFEGREAARGSFSTAISKSIILSAKVEMLLSKQKRCSPASLAVKT